MTPDRAPPPALLLVFRAFPGKEWSLLDDLDEADEDTEALAEGYRVRGFRVVRYVLADATAAPLCTCATGGMGGGVAPLFCSVHAYKPGAK